MEFPIIPLSDYLPVFQLNHIGIQSTLIPDFSDNHLAGVIIDPE
jgi:hypothetical protein